jgi:hypothetical protein
MRTEQLIDLIEHPWKLDSPSVAAMEEIINTYPFCQPVQLLYLKGLQIGGSIRFNHRMKLAAAYAGNRKLLFELLDSTLAATPEAASQPGPENPGMVSRIEDLLPIADPDLLLFDFPVYSEDEQSPVPVPEPVTEIPDSLRMKPDVKIRSMGDGLGNAGC